MGTSRWRCRISTAGLPTVHRAARAPDGGWPLVAPLWVVLRNNVEASDCEGLQAVVAFYPCRTVGPRHTQNARKSEMCEMCLCSLARGQGPHPWPQISPPGNCRSPSVPESWRLQPHRVRKDNHFRGFNRFFSPPTKKTRFHIWMGAKL